MGVGACRMSAGAGEVIHIGVDEAGLGPALGPLCIAATAFRTPEDAAPDWDTLAGCVSRKPVPGRIWIGDSKAVHAARGVAGLECAVLAGTHAVVPLPRPLRRDDLLERLGAAPLPDACPWYTSEAPPLPRACSADDLDAAAATLAEGLHAAGMVMCAVEARVLAAPELNARFAGGRNKAEVVQDALAGLLRSLAKRFPDEPLRIVLDRQGGRVFYAPFLGDVFDGAWVEVIEERAAGCAYALRSGGRDIHVTIRPKADADHLPVAWASMVAKYLRELLMESLNGYFLARCPGLKPTAGYHGDAPRFMDAVRPHLREAGLEESILWRAR